jgi:hypothetical protein
MEPVLKRMNFTKLDASDRKTLIAAELDKAIKSIRRLDSFENNPIVNFEWPTVDDLKKMTKNQPFKLASIRYQTQIPTNSDTVIIWSIGIKLQNGAESELFRGSDPGTMVNEVHLSRAIKFV